MEEKQYAGQNKYAQMLRLIMALFCFVGYYWSENPKPVKVGLLRIGSYPVAHIPESGTIFFVAGLLILAFSILMNYVLHLHLILKPDALIIDGFWRTRKIVIDFNRIKRVRKIRYKRNIFRRSVYNFHYRGIIKFYTVGDEFIELIDVDGLKYRIGSARAKDFNEIINKILRNRKK